MEGIESQALDIRDTDVIPEISHLYSMERIIQEAHRFGVQLASRGLIPARLWADFGDSGLISGLVSSDPRTRGYAEWRLFRLADIARVLGTDNIVLTGNDDNGFPVTGDKGHLLEEILSTLLEYDPGLTLVFVPAENQASVEESPVLSASNRVRAWSMTSRT